MDLKMRGPFDDMCDDLEKQELQSPDGRLSPYCYAQLLAIYLYQHDLCNAKLLWKRIPQSISRHNPELIGIWAIGQNMWKKDMVGVYIAMRGFKWNGVIKHIINATEEKTRDNAFQLISKSYTKISLNSVMTLTGLTREMAIRACREKKWQINDNMVRPVKPTESVPSTSARDNDQQLKMFTDYVSLLEN